VFQNAAFPQEVRRGRPGRREIEEKVMRVLAAVGLDRLADREATKLSGGQQQRLALARALVMEPDLLLLDEPLSNLDAKLRARMCFELKRLQRELELTTIYVTHDQSEALALSHAIAVMNEGQIVQIGSPREIYERPRNRFVADFVGTTNFLDATVLAAGGRDGRYRVTTDLGEFSAQAADPLRPGDVVALSVRPEHIHLSEDRLDPDAGGNVCEGTVDAKVFLGERVDFQIRVGERILLARGHPSLPTAVGEKIFLRMDADKCIAIPDPGA
jgi:iron(III) transport system ATP-binding protein